MFDVSFTELMLIGVVALIVIGPERLPKVARTVGHLLGRAQRYVTDVKTDIQREIDLDEMNKLKKQMDDAANSLQASMRETSASIQNPLEEARKSLKEASASVEGLVEQARKDVGSGSSPAAEDAPAALAEPVPQAAVIPDATSGAEPTTAEQSDTPK
ncbi:MAG: twin-arginine translocase subunit TatB [Alcaligenaceae bacterium]|nr:twin-arginine translocase subunit TatB [Alcaligenaceae bacterium]